MNRGHLDVTTSMYRSTYAKGGVQAEISVRLSLVDADGSTFSCYCGPTENRAKGSVYAYVSYYASGDTALRIAADLYGADSSTLLGASKLLSVAEKVLAVFDAEDGTVSSLAEAIRRACRAFGVRELTARGSDKEDSVLVGSWDGTTRDVSELCCSMLSRFAQAIDKKREEKEEETAAA